MAFRGGLGPVFASEWLTATRRRRMYAVRSGFVGLLLLGLWSAWMKSGDWTRTGPTPINAQAAIARDFYQAVVFVEMVVVLLAAPAAPAGAICTDKARGTLLHVLVTDLSDAEIVFGKLAARLVPVLGLIGCSLPVVALGTLLGGIDPVALTGSFLVLVGMAVLGCTLALALSVWARKPHEVLLATYLVWVLWFLTIPAWVLVNNYLLGSIWTPPRWVMKPHPYMLTVGANDPSVSYSPSVGDQAIFLAVAIGISAGLLALTVLRLRPVIIGQWGRGERSSRQHRRRWPAGSWLRWASPTLDGNPVLWREWHRSRPSRWARIVWGVYIALAAGSSVAAVAMTGRGGLSGGEMPALINGFQASIGLLLFCVLPATSLSEERVRGTLDVLLATPLSTRTIVMGKWWGAFRHVPLLAILPGLVAAALAWEIGGWIGPRIGPPLIVLLILAYGAAITSLGLALATWIRQTARVLSLCVAAVVGVTVGSIPVVFVLFQGDLDLARCWAMVSPFFGVGYLSAMIQGLAGPEQWPAALAFAIFWIAMYSVAAALLCRVTLDGFDRCLGRMPESPGSSLNGAPDLLGRTAGFAHREVG